MRRSESLTHPASTPPTSPTRPSIGKFTIVEVSRALRRSSCFSCSPQRSAQPSSPRRGNGGPHQARDGHSIILGMPSERTCVRAQEGCAVNLNLPPHRTPQPAGLRSRQRGLISSLYSSMPQSYFRIIRNPWAASDACPSLVATPANSHANSGVATAPRCHTL
ncbi:hypothetical protein BC834DRAFT_879179 [Gloeopeniophorella convolvens]|nr:hypothetical protein BC834DRAFT_879179 [Gloeopeniophorella convolvens]